MHWKRSRAEVACPMHNGSPWLTTTALHHSCTAYPRFTRMAHPFDQLSLHWLTDLQAGQTSCQHSTTSSENHNLLFQRLRELRHKVGSNWCGRGGHDGELWIVSLFMRVPVSEAFWVMEDLLVDDDTLGTQTILLPADIASLTRLASPPPTSSWRWFLWASWRCGHGFLSVTSCGQHQHAGLWAEGTDNSPTEALAVVTLCGWHLCPLGTRWQRAAKFPWASE